MTCCQAGALTKTAMIVSNPTYTRIPLVVRGGRDERKVILGRDSGFYNIDGAERKWKSTELKLKM